MKSIFSFQLILLSVLFLVLNQGQEFDFSVQTSENGITNANVSAGDSIIATISNKVYYNLYVIEKNTELLKLKKIFEIENSIVYDIEEEAILYEISKETYDTI